MDQSAGASQPARRFARSGDEVFFADRRRGRAHGEVRSRARAAALAPFLDIDLARQRDRAATTIIVAGSKGKGTAAAYAAATLAATGARVGTLTSPGLRSNRERIRVDGVAIAAAPYAALVNRVATAVDAAADALPEDGYLSPTGLFTLAAVRHFLDTDCDAWVLEAGMGGRSDEVSLFAATVVILTPVFGEHLGVLGGSVGDIARDKLGIATSSTRIVVSTEQVHPEAAAALRAAASRVMVRTVQDDPLPGARWPREPVGANARAGVAAALELLRHRGASVDAERVRRTVATVELPGRLSEHRRETQTWLVDAATNAAAAAAARDACADGGAPDSVLVCVPDGKDVAGVRAALHGTRTLALRTDAPHLSFAAWGEAPPPLLRDIDLDALGLRVLALGTVHFIGDVLERLDVATERLFAPPA